MNKHMKSVVISILCFFAILILAIVATSCPAHADYDAPIRTEKQDALHEAADILRA